jgi:lysine/ornithine N-monooxygenase
MTDAPTGKEDVQRILDYAENVAKESRKALTQEFNQKHKGIAFETVPKVLQDSLLAWFKRRDSNLKMTFERTDSAKVGEVRSVFVGESKKVRFKLHADAVFTVAGQAPQSPSYLKELNVTVDRRAFGN